MLENENEELQRQVKEKDKTIEKIRNTSEEKDKKIKEQNKTIKEKDKTIKEQNKIIKEQNKTIKEKDLMISKLSICACKCLGPEGAILCQCKQEAENIDFVASE